MTKAILLLVLCQLAYLAPAHLLSDPISMQVDIPLSIRSEIKTNSISLELEIHNNLTTSSIKWGNSYIKSGGMRNSFYRIEAGQKASFLATKNGKGKGSFTDPYLEDEQNTTSGIVTLNIAGKSNALTLFWEVSSDPDIPNSIGYYWGNQTSNANLYELILNEQLSNSFVKKSYETWAQVDVVGDIKMALFISDQKEATAKILIWEEKTYLTEGIYTITWDAGLGKELCLDVSGVYLVPQWAYCNQNSINQEWVLQTNASNWYSIRSNYRRDIVLKAVTNSGIPTLLSGNNPVSFGLDENKFSLQKEEGKWRVFNTANPSYFWTGDFKLDSRYQLSSGKAGPYAYQVLFRQRDDSFSNQLFKFNLVKFVGDS